MIFRSSADVAHLGGQEANVYQIVLIKKDRLFYLVWNVCLLVDFTEQSKPFACLSLCLLVYPLA